MILDEAYVDFASADAMRLHKLPNVLVSRAYRERRGFPFTGTIARVTLELEGVRAERGAGLRSEEQSDFQSRGRIDR